MAYPFFNSNKKSDRVDKQAFKRLILLYSIAVAAIALTIIVSERYLQLQLNRQLYDSKVVNLAGRQRTYGEKITKNLLLLSQAHIFENAEEVVAELDDVLTTWNTAHFALINGDPTLGIPNASNAHLRSKLDTLTLFQKQIFDETTKVLEADLLNGGKNQEIISPVLFRILELEEVYLFRMNEIVGLFEAIAKRKVERAKNIQTLLAIISLGILFFEVLFIFRPLAIYVRHHLRKLLHSEWLLNRTIKKSESLQNHLKASNDDLQNIYFALEEATLFARAKSNGDIYYISNQFLEKLHFDKNEEFKYNLFKIINIKDWIHEIENSIEERNIWRNELKLKTFSGNFIWIDARVVPVFSKDNEFNDLLIICNDITHRKWAEQKVYQLNRERYLQKSAEQRQNSIRIIEALEKERKRISRDIHDGLGQLLTATKFNLQSINLDYPEKAKSRLAEIKMHVGEIIQETRKISFNLAPSNLEDYGISSALKTLASQVRQQTGIEVLYENNYYFEERLPKNLEVNIYRICQEAINNAVKHGNPKRIIIIFKSDARGLEISIKDDGVGFNKSQLNNGNKQFAIASGILNMMERVNFFDGEFKLDTNPGKGTLVSIFLPITTTKIA